jgi:predicted PurR-regulated permease PerM
VKRDYNKAKKKERGETGGKVAKLVPLARFFQAFWWQVMVPKALLVAVLVIFLISLAGVFVAHALPHEVEEHATLLEYTHNGKFDYLAYLKPSYLYGPPPEPLPPNPKYPTRIIDSFNLTFSSRQAEGVSQTAVINAVLENPGIWQKEIKLVPETTKTGSLLVKFSLDIDELNELIDNIAQEVGVLASSYDLTIVADVRIGGGEFTHTLPMELSKTIIEVDRDLSYSESGYDGKFDYEVHLKENSIYEESILESPEIKTQPSSHLIRSGEVIISELVDRIYLTFAYNFESSKSVSQLTEEVQINAILENPNFWSKEFVLVPPTVKSGDFDVTFPLDLHQFTELIEAIQEETGILASAYRLNIKADVHTTAETGSGTIDEDFSQIMTSTLGQGVLDWGKELESSKEGSIEESRVIPNPKKYVGLSVAGLRRLSIIIASIIFVLFLYLSMLYMRFRLVGLSEIEGEARRVKKKYKDLIVDIEELPVAKEEETIIPLSSLDDLATAAEELLKPVLHKAEEKRHIYCTIDGSTRYEYISELPEADDQV